MITIKIDVTKIDKSRLYKGNKGTYLSAVLIPTPDGKYGDWMIVEEVTKEEREAGKKGTILGNGKNVGQKQTEAPPSNVNYERDSMLNKKQGEEDRIDERAAYENEHGDDLPF